MIDRITTITIALTSIDRRVIVNGMNREWDHLEKLKRDLGVRIAVEKDLIERADMVARHDKLTSQQNACDEMIRRIESL